MSDLHESVAAHLQRRLVERATGRSEDLVLDNRPRNVAFAGCLAPRPDAATDDLESAEDFFARLAPSAIQLRFLVPAVDRLIMHVTPRCHVYYRVIPPFEAQQRRTPKGEAGLLSPEALVRAYRKCIPAFEPIEIAIAESESLP